jgi:hypothetical protein
MTQWQWHWTAWCMSAAAAPRDVQPMQQMVAGGLFGCLHYDDTCSVQPSSRL